MQHDVAAIDTTGLLEAPAKMPLVVMVDAGGEVVEMRAGWSEGYVDERAMRLAQDCVRSQWRFLAAHVGSQTYPDWVRVTVDVRTKGDGGSVGR